MASSEIDFKKYVNLINKKKRLFVITALAIMTGAVFLCYLLPVKYEANSTVYIEKSIISELVKGLAVTPSIEDKMKVLLYAFNSRTLMTKVINELDLNVKKHSDAQLEEMIREFQENTDIKLKDKEGLFIISFKHENPKVARDYVNTLIRRYIEENVSAKREESYGATTFFSDQIKSFKEKLDKTEEDANKFKNEKAALLSLDEVSVRKEISDSQQKLDEIRSKRLQVESIIGNLKKHNPLQSKLQALNKRLNELRMEYTDNYPDVIKIKSDIESINEQIRKGVKGPAPSDLDPMELDKWELELKTLKKSEAYQRNLISTNLSLLHGIPTAKSNLERLEREKNNQKLIYEQLIARQGQSEISKQMEVQDKSTTFRIVDPAVIPIKPISPNRVKVILLGIVAGLAGGLGLLLLLDFMDPSVRDVESLKTLGVPILAVIPVIKNPVDVSLEKKQALRLYWIAGVYFSIILAVLLVEVLDISLMNDLAVNLRLPQLAAEVMGSFK